MSHDVPRSSPVARYVGHVMGMPVSLALRGRHAHDRVAHGAWAEVMAALRDVDRVFSTYRPETVVSRLGRGELDLDHCPVEVAEVLELGRRIERESGGAFAVHRDAVDGSPRLDPTGVVKGWAVDRATRPLRQLDDTDFALSAGGDLVCATADPGSPPWRIGVEDPHDTSRLVAALEVHNGAVATSGTAHRGAHLVDARTGECPLAVASVTVVAASLTEADLDATAGFALGPDAARWLRQRPGRSGLVCWQDGTTSSYAVPPAGGGDASGQ